MSRIDRTRYEGIEFDMEQRNCYQLLRRVYAGSFGIDLPDAPCPTRFWESGRNFFNEYAPTAGFKTLDLHPSEWREGDVLVIAVQASVGNHCAILLDTGDILHHLVGQRSCVTSFGGMFRNGLVGVYRHKDVVPEPPAPSSVVDLRDLLPRHVRRRLEDAQAAQQPQGEAPAGS